MAAGVAMVAVYRPFDGVFIVRPGGAVMTILPLSEIHKTKNLMAHKRIGDRPPKRAPASRRRKRGF